MNDLNRYKTQLESILSDLNTIKPYRLSFGKIGQIGHIMKCFYKTYKDENHVQLLEYTLGFNGYIDNLLSLQNNYNKKLISKCRFSKKTTKFKDAYYPNISKKTLVKNSYNLKKHMIITDKCCRKNNFIKNNTF